MASVPIDKVRDFADFAAHAGIPHGPEWNHCCVDGVVLIDERVETTQRAIDAALRTYVPSEVSQQPTYEELVARVAALEEKVRFG